MSARTPACPAAVTRAEAVQTPARLDVTADVCPSTWVRARSALEALDAGELLQLRLNGEALRNVPRSIKEDGHRVIGVRDGGDSTYTLTIRKDGLL